MNLSDFDYDLPEELIAQEPLPERDASRLLAVERRSGRVSHGQFRDLPGLVGAPALFVVNDSRVIPARLYARKPTGGEVEVLVIEPDTDGGGWKCLISPARKVRAGMKLDIDCRDGLAAEVGKALGNGFFSVWFDLPGGGGVVEFLKRAGRMPLPPYIKPERSGRPELFHRQRYQTVYAERDGAVAAPTAGLHFSERVLEDLAGKGHQVAKLTLHVGPDTFLPVRSDDFEKHALQGEKFAISAETAGRINEARQAGWRIIAVGTTVVRALEEAALRGLPLQPCEGVAMIYIRPGHGFKVVDAMVTNFHLPKTTLLLLVSAFAGRQLLLKAYAEAVKSRYRFYSYGDAMLIL